MRLKTWVIILIAVAAAAVAGWMLMAVTLPSAYIPSSEHVLEINIPNDAESERAWSVEAIVDLRGDPRTETEHRLLELKPAALEMDLHAPGAEVETVSALRQAPNVLGVARWSWSITSKEGLQSLEVELRGVDINDIAFLLGVETAEVRVESGKGFIDAAFASLSGLGRELLLPLSLSILGAVALLAINKWVRPWFEKKPQAPQD